MALEPRGELVPVGGGDPIPLHRARLVVGRREKCDICLRFSNISGTHCELIFKDGYWMIRDLNSTNGVKVNNERVTQRPLRPGDEVSIAHHRYTIQYDLQLAGAQALQDLLEDDEAAMSQPLLEKAGLVKPKHTDTQPEDEDDDF
ncbi:MAG TPA: FHA domain-containing protein [Gemmataceae bacterium]